MSRSIRSCLAILACAGAPAAYAQDAAPGRFGFISVFQGPAEDRDDLVRTAMPAGDTSEWVSGKDYPAQAIATGTKGNVQLRVRVSAADAVTGCSVVEPSAPEPLREAACRLVRERGRFLHALSAAGQPIEADASLYFYFTIRDVDGPELFPPAPPPPPSGGYPYTPTLKLLDKPDWAAHAPAGKPDGELVVSVGVLPPRGSTPERRTCAAERSSGNAALDAATCEAARNARYALLTPAPYANIKMLVRWRKGKASLELPTRTRGTPLAIEGGDAAARLPADSVGRQSYAVATFRANGTVGCRISRSSGSDATDLAICAHVRKLRFTPETDLFGRDVTATRYFRYGP